MASGARRRPPPAAARRSPVSVPSAASRDADGPRAAIRAIATEEFAKKGLSGSRVDEIAERTHTVKRMIYYYFGSKEGLYRAVLERCYDHIRMIESDLDLDALPPNEALRRLVRSEEHTSELQSPCNLVCRLLLEKKKNNLHRAVNRSTSLIVWALETQLVWISCPTDIV